MTATIESITCPSWCTQEHGFVDEHDGQGHGTLDGVCILAEADFGAEADPIINIMIGDFRKGAFCVHVTPAAARSLVEALEQPDMLADIKAALRAVLMDVSA